MSIKGVEAVLSRAMSDPAFVDELFADSEKALTGYELTADELASLKSMSRADLENFSMAAPEERKSFSLLSNAVSQTIKGIGDGLRQVGRGG